MRIKRPVVLRCSLTDLFCTEGRAQDLNYDNSEQRERSFTAVERFSSKFLTKFWIGQKMDVKDVD